MVVIKCLFQECSYQTQDESCELVCRLLDLHKVEHKNNSCSSIKVSMLNESQLIRSRVDCEISQETQFAFIFRWEAFKIGSNISSQNASIQLFQCANDKLCDLMLANYFRLMAKSKEFVAKLMESVTVLKVSAGLKRAELMSLH